ncbi:hypothetical protein GCM10025734_22440 [Kitasatospora paranensis]
MTASRLPGLMRPATRSGPAVARTRTCVSGISSPIFHTTSRWMRQIAWPAADSSGSGATTRSVSTARVPTARMVRAPASAFTSRVAMPVWAAR